MPAVKLTPEQEQELRNLDAEIATLHRELDKAEKIGIDVSQMRAILQQHDKMRKAMIAAYGATAALQY